VQQLLWLETLLKFVPGLLLALAPLTTLRVLGLPRPETGFWPRLLERAIGETFAEGFNTFDLLPPTAPYKERLARTEIGVVDWAVPLSRNGAAYTRLYLGFARPAMKAALAAQPAAMRRLLARIVPGLMQIS
jgi:hypothetical protein